MPCSAFDFTAFASGGEGPYTFSWEFGDKARGNGTPILHEYSSAGNYTVQLTVQDSSGRTLVLTELISIVSEAEEDGDGIAPVQTESDGNDSNFDIYATSTGVIGLLLIFGLFGRKRRESFLEA